MRLQLYLMNINVHLNLKKERFVNWPKNVCLKVWVKSGIPYIIFIYGNGFQTLRLVYDIPYKTILVGTKLIAAGVGQRNTVFVCYSMGGLVFKKMLELHPEIGSKLKGCLFLATPHFGSPVAKRFVDEQEEYGTIFGIIYLLYYNNITLIIYILVPGLARGLEAFKVVTPEVVMLGNKEENLEELNNKFVNFVKCKGKR